ncbi:hypothetical protein BP5796_09334 [Coleophoma crateriformis]|uniref:Uncharacterized protein n=1 Tax=Coleophoma crateriformis TaxID=565419 RepID=A0A3D8R3S3_9HELO|nr:hypothetical protein BP5796_09334 [Coleophoma crateriformis]
MPTAILYDIPSRGPCACWSPNPWKTRLLLNYKNIDYKTEWVEYPDIAAKYKELGIPPNPKEPYPYAIPGISIETSDGLLHLQGSREIATVIEEYWPTPSVHLDSPYMEKIDTFKFVGPLATLLMPRNAQNILSPVSVEYFSRTRSARFGMTLDEFENSKPVDEVWANATKVLSELADMLKENPSGPFLMGKEVSYADFIVVGVFQFYKRAGQDIFDRAMAVDTALHALYDACEPWLKRDNH